MYIHSSRWFVDTIRRTVAGATLVTELLDSAINDNQILIDEIIQEYDGLEKDLLSLVRLARELSTTITGRIDVRRLADYYRTEASWPTDDITLRRAYIVYKNGELSNYLPEVDKLIKRQC
jgi:hypothetical protein